MNDLESKLRSLSFREPPPGLRAGVIAAARPLGWKSWLAPHPAAWAALAALWLALAVVDVLLHASDAASHAERLAEVTTSPPQPVLLAFYQRGGAVEPPL